ncbi:MAG: GNAT family N-acetyltransferase, partial [Clostridiales bacterium]|nr:GNAT family N-acetyltransferase [Clostridiales bacterium]
MAQLKMYWFPGTPIPELNLPDGYSVSNYKDESDIDPWVKCCANGLVDEENGRETFKSTILDMNYLDPCRDVFFLDYYGEHIGTVTAFKRLDTGEGDMHMVAIRTDFRGRGLSKYLSIICCAKLEKENCKRIFLTTDEWRKGAVKGYLNAGFLPVKYDIGMEDRWCKELEVLGVDSVKMVNDDGTDYKVIYRQGLRSKKPVMGIQLYTLRDYIKTAQDFDKTLARLKSMGVNDVQISAIGDFPAQEQAEFLTKYNINCCVTHKSFDRMLTDLDKRKP